MKIKITIQQILILTTLFFTSCESDYLKLAPKPLKGKEPTVFFATNIEPELNAKCAKCHITNGSSKPFLKLKTGYAYVGIMNNPNKRVYVDTLKPEESLLYKKCATGGTMAQYTTPELLTKILTWITEGARNN